MASTISEAVQSSCETKIPEPDAARTRAAGAPVAPPRRALVSVKQLKEEIAKRRQAVAELQAERERDRQALSEVRSDIARLKVRAQTLEASMADKSQAAFLIINELDHLQTLEAKVSERAKRAAREHAPVANTDLGLAPNDDPGPSAGAAERRAQPRTPVAVEIGMSTDNNFYVGFTQDISTGGLFIATADTMPIGNRFLVECQLPTMARKIRCIVEVAWVREYNEGMSYSATSVPGMGVKFVGLSDEDAQAIAAFQAERQALFFPDGTEAGAC
ncbi:MAG: PilZ domain-containing protein [Deltaproteobacteria bacterium]|nr:PilZ domain-containing protein [Deltaproteobacteria bacterium]